jgi:hypothetical protein
MYICPICNKEHDTLRKISKHLQTKHNLIPKDVLFELYPDLFRNCGYCGIKIKQTLSDKQSRKFCGSECEVEWRKMRIQSPETIAKRIKNTDQKKKEENRQATMVGKYSALYHFPEPENRNKKISEALRGTSHSEEHHKKVINSKRKNGTLNHKQETKDLISLKITLNYQSDNPPNSIPKNGKGGRGYKSGYLNGYYYRSSYEKQFINTCLEHNIKIESAETKEFRVLYEFNGKKKCYYPDFYLPDYTAIIEIKPTILLDTEINSLKFDAALKHHKNFIILTEEDIFDNNLQWVHDLEYFLH